MSGFCSKMTHWNQLFQGWINGGQQLRLLNMTPLPSLLVSEKICNFERGTKRGTPPQFRSFGTKTSPKMKMFQTLFEFLINFFRARWKNPCECIQCFFKCGRSSLEIQFHGVPATILAGIWFPLMKSQVGAKNHGWRQKSYLIFIIRSGASNAAHCCGWPRTRVHGMTD